MIPFSRDTIRSDEINHHFFPLKVLPSSGYFLLVYIGALHLQNLVVHPVRINYKHALILEILCLWYSSILLVLTNSKFQNRSNELDVFDLKSTVALLFHVALPGLSPLLANSISMSFNYLPSRPDYTSINMILRKSAANTSADPPSAKVRPNWTLPYLSGSLRNWSDYFVHHCCRSYRLCCRMPICLRSVSIKRQGHASMFICLTSQLLGK